jgi:hypothetical protein
MTGSGGGSGAIFTGGATGGNDEVTGDNGLGSNTGNGEGSAAGTVCGAVVACTKDLIGVGSFF